jgi:hypothetical protein
MTQPHDPFIQFPSAFITQANPYAGREKDAEEARRRADAVERTHIANLMANESGLWILRRLIGGFEATLRQTDASEYMRGVQDATKAYRDLVIKHFGHSGIDKILGGK